MNRGKSKLSLSVVMQPIPIKSPPVCTERNCVRLFGNLLCLFIVSLGAGISATATYILVNYEYVIEVFGREVFFGAVYTLLACGIFTVITGLFGFYDFTHENRFTAILTTSGLILLSIFILVAGIVTFIYPRGMQHLLLKALVDTLPQYGSSIAITRAWDRMQSYLRCCAVQNLGWRDYNKTVWYSYVNQNVYETEDILPMASPYYTAVPPSCCATLIDSLTGYATQTFRDLNRCQRWQYGPPQLQSGPHNDALYYRGCFLVLTDYMLLHTRHLFGLSLSLVGIMIATLIVIIAAKLTKQVRKKTI